MGTGSRASDGSFRRTFTSDVRGVLPSKFTSILPLFAPVFYNKSCNLGRWGGKKNTWSALKFGMFIILTPNQNVSFQLYMTPCATETACKSGLGPLNI